MYRPSIFTIARAQTGVVVGVYPAHKGLPWYFWKIYWLELV